VSRPAVCSGEDAVKAFSKIGYAFNHQTGSPHHSAPFIAPPSQHSEPSRTSQRNAARFDSRGWFNEKNNSRNCFSLRLPHATLVTNQQNRISHAVPNLEHAGIVLKKNDMKTAADSTCRGRSSIYYPFSTFQLNLIRPLLADILLTINRKQNRLSDPNCSILVWNKTSLPFKQFWNALSKRH
jgi:hypothetical protein